MRLLFSLLAACLWFTAIVPVSASADSPGVNWQMRYGDEGNTNFSTASLPTDLTLSKQSFTNASSMFAVDQNQLYSVERIQKKILSATDLKTNQEKWEFQAEGNAPFLDLIASNGVIYASTMNKLYALADNGSSSVVKWSINTTANRLTADQNTLYYLQGNTIVAVDSSTGTTKWNHALAANERVDGKFAVGGNRIYFTGLDPVNMKFTLYALDSANGNVLWTTDLGYGATSSSIPVYKDEKVYLDRHDFSIKTNPGTITAFDAAKGKTLWQYGINNYFTQPVTVNDDSVIALDDANLIALDKNTGAEKWKVLYADQVMAGGLQTVKGTKGLLQTSDKIVLENNNKLKFFNPTNGQLLFATAPLETPTGGPGVKPIGVIDNTLFVTEANTLLYTYGSSNAITKDTIPPTGSFDLASMNDLSPKDGVNQIRIPFTISEEADVEINLVDESGEVARTFGLGRHLKGSSEVYWDSKNDRGFNVAQGRYYPVLKLTDLSGNKGTYEAKDKIIEITQGFGITNHNVNLRSGPGTQNSIICVVPSGSEVTITSETDGWYQVEYRMIRSQPTGYISKSLITVPSNVQISKIQTGKMRVTANVRSYAGTQYDSKYVIPMNSDVKIIQAVGDWYLIEYQKDSAYSDQGYVAKYLVAIPSSTNIVYTVQTGDTLWKIAQKYGVTVDTIIKLNHLDPNQYLYIGQKLTISN